MIPSPPPTSAGSPTAIPHRSPPGAPTEIGRGEDLFAILKRMLVEQAAADAARPPTTPLACGDARIGGRHLWRANGKTHQGTLLICACGARAREGFDGDLFAEAGYGPPPANRETP